MTDKRLVNCSMDYNIDPKTLKITWELIWEDEDGTTHKNNFDRKSHAEAFVREHRVVNSLGDMVGQDTPKPPPKRPRKTPAKKTVSKRAPAKKTAAKKAPARKAAVKKK